MIRPWRLLVAGGAAAGVFAAIGSPVHAYAPPTGAGTYSQLYITSEGTLTDCLGDDPTGTGAVTPPQKVQNQGGVCFDLTALPATSPGPTGKWAITAMTIADQQFQAVDGDWQIESAPDPTGNQTTLASGLVCSGSSSAQTVIPAGSSTLFVFAGSPFDFALPAPGGCGRAGSAVASAGTITVTITAV